MAVRVVVVRVVLFSLIVSLAWPALAHARGAAVDSQSPAPPQTQAPSPPPPLFPRHRRVLYLDGQGQWMIDATPQSPPLDTDDPGVPDAGAYEINFTTDVDASRSVRTFDLLFVDANYGVLPTIFGHQIPTQLKVEVPVSAVADNGHPLTAALGAAAVGVKFNFYNNERHGLSLAWYPQLGFAPGLRAVEDGPAEHGQTLVLPLLLSKELSYVTLVANGAVNTPIHDSTRHVTGTFGVAVGVALTRKLAVMTELHSETRFDFAHDRLLSANVGLMRAIGRTLALYASIGHSLFSDDGLNHIYAGAGVKVLIPHVR
jgi:hypothetical protein